MRVLILSQYYAPEPILKPVELAQELKRLGHDVYVITGFPDYPSGVLYSGYKLGLLRKEIIDGIPVIRTYEYPNHGTRALGRFVNYLSFMLSAPFGLLGVPKVDVMYVWHPPLTIGIAAWLIAKIRRIPFAYDVQDIWPEAAVLSGILKPGLIVKCLSFLERLIYKGADHLIVVTEGAKGNLISKNVPSHKITALPHWIDERTFQNSAPELGAAIRDRFKWGDKFVVLFAGNMGLVQGLETVVRAAADLRQHQDILFVFLGDGTDRERLQRLVIELKLTENIQFVNRQPLEAMPMWMSAAHAMLVHLKDSELSDYVVPTKTLAYLAAGKPVIMAMNGAAADIVKAAKAGICLPPENPGALAAAVLRLKRCGPGELKEFGRNGKDYLDQNYTQLRVVPRYTEILTNLVTKRVAA